MAPIGKFCTDRPGGRKNVMEVSDGKLWFIAPQGIAGLTQELHPLTTVKQGPRHLRSSQTRALSTLAEQQDVQLT